MACPFCGVEVQVTVERAQLAPSSNVASRRIASRRSAGGGPVTIETLTAEEVQKLAAEEAAMLFEGARREALRRHRAAPLAAEPPGTPWDTERGVRPFFQTLAEVLRAPRRFFASLSAASPLPAVGFAVLVLVPGATAHVLAADWLLAKYGLEALVPTTTIALAVAVTVPLGVLYLVAMYHAGATILPRRRLKMYGVVRATCYGFAPLLLAVIPLIGLAIGGAWSLVLHFFALRRHLGLSVAQALVALSLAWLPVAALLSTV